MKTKNERAREQAKAQLASIREMVAALECDYERLEELEDEREELHSTYLSAAHTYQIARRRTMYRLTLTWLRSWRATQRRTS